MNGLASKYQAGSSTDRSSDFSGGADVWPEVARVVWKHWQREARVASDDGGGITQLANWCKTSWTSFRLCSWIFFCISRSIWSVNCWFRPGRGVSSTQHMSPVADVEATASSGSGAVVTNTALMAWIACMSKTGITRASAILRGMYFGRDLAGNPI